MNGPGGPNIMSVARSQSYMAAIERYLRRNSGDFQFLAKALNYNGAIGGIIF